jgi:hypothetical protein
MSAQVTVKRVPSQKTVAKPPAKRPKTAVVSVPAKSVAAPAKQASTSKRGITPALAPAPTPAAKRAVVLDAPKEPAKVKTKLVRDSFTMPKVEYATLDVLKHRAITLTQPVKKSELLRAGVKALSAMSDKAFLAALKAVPTIKTGRPGKA